MDLREKIAGYDQRHPWELSRIGALKDILMNDVPLGRQVVVLDVGCGDGFVSRELHNTGKYYSITGVDTYLSSQQIAELSSQCDEITYYNDYRQLLGKGYDLILMLDVIEHIENDKDFVFEMINKYMADGGCILVTAPAFHSLYGSHDRFLKHYRRYSRKQLLGVLEATNLECILSGYLFVFLLPIRFMFVFLENIFRIRKDNESGVGAWRCGRMITRICECLLTLDNRLTLYFTRRGIIIPGLTVWALCKKPRS
jgi:2-polyprenyl-3-methyl-5-hydroxy-6-metoxy-1,4-benzoquinol methylase